MQNPPRQKALTILVQKTTSRVSLMLLKVNKVKQNTFNFQFGKLNNKPWAYAVTFQAVSLCSHLPSREPMQSPSKPWAYAVNSKPWAYVSHLPRLLLSSTQCSPDHFGPCRMFLSIVLLDKCIPIVWVSSTPLSTFRRDAACTLLKKAFCEPKRWRWCARCLL